MRINIAVAAAKDDAVCPEGKEKSSGGGIIRLAEGFAVNGLILPTRGFKKSEQSKTSSKSAESTPAPMRRYFGRSSITSAAASQISP